PLPFSSLPSPFVIHPRTLATCHSSLLTFRRPLHRLKDVLIARAAAEVPFQALANFLTARVRIARKELVRGEYHARRAEAALQTVLLPKALLERMELALGREALDCGQFGAVGLDGKHRARLDGLLVHQNRAGAANRSLAADVSPGEPRHFTQVVDQQEPRLNLVLAPRSVNSDANLHNRLPPADPDSSACLSPPLPNASRPLAEVCTYTAPKHGSQPIPAIRLNH